MRSIVLLIAMVCTAFGCASYETDDWQNESGDSGFELETIIDSAVTEIDSQIATPNRLSTKAILSPPIEVEAKSNKQKVDSRIESNTNLDSGFESDPIQKNPIQNGRIINDSKPDLDSNTDSGVDSGITDSEVDSSTDSAIDTNTDSGVDSGFIDSSTDSSIDSGSDSGQPICEIAACDIIGDAGTQLQRQSFASVETLSCYQGEDEWTEERICDLTEVCLPIEGDTSVFPKRECKPCELDLLSNDTITNLIYNPNTNPETIIDCLGCQCHRWLASTGGPSCPTLFPINLEFLPPLSTVTNLRFNMQIRSNGSIDINPTSNTKINNYGMNFFEKGTLKVNYEFWVTGQAFEAGAWIQYALTVRLQHNCGY